MAADYIPLATASVLEAPESTGAAAAPGDADSDEEAEAEERMRMAFGAKAPGGGRGGVLAGVAEEIEVRPYPVWRSRVVRKPTHLQDSTRPVFLSCSAWVGMLQNPSITKWERGLTGCLGIT